MSITLNGETLEALSLKPRIGQVRVPTLMTSIQRGAEGCHQHSK